MELGRLQVKVGEISMEIANLTFQIEDLEEKEDSNVHTWIAKKVALQRDMKKHQEEIKIVMTKMEKIVRA